MAKCKLTGHEFVHSVFSPCVAILCSHDAEVICQKNNLSFCELIRPFIRLNQDVFVRDSNGISHVVRGLQIRCVDMAIAGPLQVSSVKKLLSDTVSACQTCDTAAAMVSSGNYDLYLNNSTPWFEAYRENLLTTMPATEHEFLNHAISCVFVVSSNHVSPLEQFAKLTQVQHQQQFQQSARGPKWFTPNTLRYYVLLHDLSQGDEKKADAIFQTVKSTYGAGQTHFLPINSRASNSANGESAASSASENLLPDPWAQYIHPWNQGVFHSARASGLSNSNGSLGSPSFATTDTIGAAHPLMLNSVASPSMPDGLTAGADFEDDDQEQLLRSASLPQLNNCDYGGGNSNVMGSQRHGACITTEDQQRIRSFVHEFIVRALLPWVEKTMKVLNDQTASKMRLSRSLLSATKKWFGTSTKPPVSAPLSQNASSTSVVYSQEAPEVQLRRYADLAFLFQQYEVAHQVYQHLKKEFQNDGAWIHYAGAMEMSAMSIYMQESTSQRQYPSSYMETAILAYLQTCKNVNFATRATLLSTEALKSKGMFLEASVQYIKMTTEDSDLRSALLLEQAAHCFVNMRTPMLRKFAFHMILAGHRFGKAGQRKHSMRCYAQALQVYKGRGWRMAEDHINMVLSKHSAVLKQLDAASHAAAQLLHCESRQIAAQQASFLKEYIFLYKQNLENMIGPDKTLIDGSLPQLPLPLVTQNEVKVMLGKPVKQLEEHVSSANLDPDIEVVARGVHFSDSDLSAKSWLRLEAALVAYGRTEGAPNFATLDNLSGVELGGVVVPPLRSSLYCFTRHTDNQHHPKAVVGEPVTVQIPLENPMQVPLVLTEVYLLWQFTPMQYDQLQHATHPTTDLVITNQVERDKIHFAKEVVMTEILPDFYLLPAEKKPVELMVIPKQTGQLRIVGLAYTLGTHSPNQSHLHSNVDVAENSNSPSLVTSPSGAMSSGGGGAAINEAAAAGLRGRQPLEVHGPRLNRTLEDRCARIYGPDRRLDLLVTPIMPLLRVAFTQFPVVMVVGEVRRVAVKLHNAGQLPMRCLRLASTRPDLFSFGFDEFAHTLDNSVYQKLQPGAKLEPSVYGGSGNGAAFCHGGVIPVPLAAPGLLQPGCGVSLPLWIRAPAESGCTTIDMLFYYESTEPNPKMKHRVLRHRAEIEVLPSLHLAAHISRSKNPITDSLVVQLEIENESQESLGCQFSLLQVSCASRNWTLSALNPPAGAHVQLAYRETARLTLRVDPPPKSETLLTKSTHQPFIFSGVPFGAAEQPLHAGGSPAADFLLLEETSGSSGSPRNSVVPLLTLVVMWQATCPLRRQLTGQSHLRVTELDTELPARLPLVGVTPPIMEANRIMQLSKLVKMSLLYETRVRHDFGLQRLLLLPVDIQLYNSGDTPLLVRLDAEDIGTSMTRTTMTSSTLRPHSPKIEVGTLEPPLSSPQSLSSSPPSSSSALPAHIPLRSGLPSCVWVGLTGHVLRIDAKSHARVSLKACVPAAGVYELHSLTVRAAPLTEDNKELSYSSSSSSSSFSSSFPASSSLLDNLTFVKQEHWWSALLIVETIVRC